MLVERERLAPRRLTRRVAVERENDLRTVHVLVLPKDPDARVIVRVWDPLVRLFHWGVAASFFLAWFTAHSAEAVHHVAGYAALGLVGLRVVWGFLGTTYARFAQFVRHPTTVLDYLKAIAAGNETRYVGHNPAGGAMVVTLMVIMTGTAATGWMMTTDRYWGVAWVGELHSALAHGLLLLVAVHFCGVLLASYRHRENLVGAMISGHKRAPEPEDVA